MEVCQFKKKWKREEGFGGNGFEMFYYRWGGINMLTF